MSRLVEFLGRVTLLRGANFGADKNKSTSSPPKIEVSFSTENYEKKLIIFIDLIGFKNYVLTNYGNGEEKAVKELTAYFQQQVSEGAKYLEGRGVTYTPTFNFFSDTVIISFPLDLFGLNCKSRDKIPFNIYKYMLLSSAYNSIFRIQLHALNHGLLTRGCVTIGDIYHNKNTWFGPGLIEAYEHECNIAIYPRVILSKCAFKYFKDEVVHDQTCSWLPDSDGYYYANYLSWIHIEFDDDFCKAHHKVRKIIIDNINFLSKNGKNKELQKWQWLALYFNKFSSELLTLYGENLSKNIEV